MQSPPEQQETSYCQYDVGMLPMGEPCPECGHSGAVHPFRGNKVEHCAICELLDQIDRMKAWLEIHGLDAR